jgi:hypothetical protein
MENRTVSVKPPQLSANRSFTGYFSASLRDTMTGANYEQSALAASGGNLPRSFGTPGRRA